MARRAAQHEAESKQADKIREQMAQSSSENETGAAEEAPKEEDSTSKSSPAPEGDGSASVADPATTKGNGKTEVTDFSQKYATLEGKYNAEVAELKGQLETANNIIASMQPSGEVPYMDPALRAGVTQEEIEEYGPDLIDLIRRVGREELKPLASKLEEREKQTVQRVQSVTQSAQQSARERLFMHMDADPELSGWREQNNDQNFIDWLKQPDIYSGLSRQQLLGQALERNDFFRVKAFFTGYKRETGQTGYAGQPGQGAAPKQESQPNALETLVTAGRPAQSGVASGASSDGKVWTPAEIDQVFRNRQNGRYTDKEWATLEADIYKAQMEGRLRV